MRFVITVLFVLLTTSAVAETMQTLAAASSTENVKEVAFQQKLAYCVSDVKNKGLNCNTYVECNEKERYVASCMNGNEAQAQYAMINNNTDFNNMLQQSPTAAGPSEPSTFGQAWSVLTTKVKTLFGDK